MKKNKSIHFFIATLIALFFSAVMNAQNNSLDQQLNTDLHGHGSMIVVFSVIGIILTGLFITLWRIDRKVAKLEKEINERKS
jgi:hypothetical protein